MTLEELQAGQIFIIDKPLDWTSFDVVKKIRWNICNVYKIKKIKVGHAGTLDPKATGVLVICTGKFTKKIEQLQSETKTYTGTIKLGATTESYDTEKTENATFPTEHITPKLIHQTMQQFIGEIEQHPPIHSAVKIAGKRLYKMARAGEEVKTQARKVQIDQFEITKIAMPFIEFKVVCSKGTYIRSLAYDFGKALDSGGYLTELRRTQSGNFKIEDADNAPMEKPFFAEKPTSL